MTKKTEMILYMNYPYEIKVYSTTITTPPIALFRKSRAVVSVKNPASKKCVKGRDTDMLKFES